MSDDNPETHKLRLKALLLEEVDEGAVIFVFTVVVVVLLVVVAAGAEVADTSAISATIRTENRKFIFN